MKWKADTSMKGHRRCGHRWCSDCRTRRGRNRGNRRFRHAAKRALQTLT